MSKADVVREAARGQWLEVLKALAPNLSDAIDQIPTHVPCPIGSGTEDGFRLFKDANETGGGISNIHGALPDGFALLMWACDWSFSEALNEVAITLDVTDWDKKDRIEPKKREVIAKAAGCDKETLNNRRAKLKRVWKESYPMNHHESKRAREYFANRSIFISQDDYNNMISKTMRFNKRLDYWHKYKELENGKFVIKHKNMGKFPAIVSLISFDDGSPASLHITYLNEKGRKLELSFRDKPLANKKLMSRCREKPLTGGSIQLDTPTSTTLNLTEGVETGLAVHVAINDTVWPCISTALLGVFNPPTGVTKLNVWADLDKNKAGYLAAVKLKKRMKEVDVEVNIFLPNKELEDNEKSIDWNDVLATMGKSYFHDALLGAA